MARLHKTIETRARREVPLGLLMFCYAMMGPACAINGAFIALALPAIAPYGLNGIVIAGLVGAVVGVLPARWLAGRIHDGISGHHTSRTN